jgi:hypothetical protein
MGHIFCVFFLICALLYLFINAYNCAFQLCTKNKFHNKESFFDTSQNVHYQEKEKKPYIWAYWDELNGKKMPAHISLCLKTLKYNCQKNFNVQILNAKSVKEWLPNLRDDLDSLHIAQKVDYIRVMLLYTYGGIWLDADIIVMKDLTPIADKINEGYDYIGFGCDEDNCSYGYGKPSNWVMGSPANSILMKNYLQSLNNKLDNKTSGYDYHGLGKYVLWDEIKKLEKLNNYTYYHYNSKYDGTRDINEKWVDSKNHLSTSPTILLDEEEAFFVVLTNYQLTNYTSYKWINEKSEDEILYGPWWISYLFRKALDINSQDED